MWEPDYLDYCESKLEEIDEEVQAAENAADEAQEEAPKGRLRFVAGPWGSR